MRALFPLGQVVATPGALAALAAADVPAMDYLQRHVTGDWGDLCVEDVDENWRSVQHGSRILSSYRLPTDV
jgi:hypothetical protein